MAERIGLWTFADQLSWGRCDAPQGTPRVRCTEVGWGCQPDEQILVVASEGPRTWRLQALLAQAGYPVELVASAAETLERFALRPPSAVFLDHALRDRRTLDLCRQLREHARSAIIVLSAEAAESAVVAALDHGADDYITDACGPEELVARLGAALRRARRAVPAP